MAVASLYRDASSPSRLVLLRFRLRAASMSAAEMGESEWSALNECLYDVSATEGDEEATLIFTTSSCPHLLDRVWLLWTDAGVVLAKSMWNIRA